MFFLRRLLTVVHWTGLSLTASRRAILDGRVQVDGHVVRDAAKWLEAETVTVAAEKSPEKEVATPGGLWLLVFRTAIFIMDFGRFLWDRFCWTYKQDILRSIWSVWMTLFLTNLPVWGSTLIGDDSAADPAPGRELLGCLETGGPLDGRNLEHVRDKKTIKSLL